MGKGEEKSGFMGSAWMTIILIAVLVILAILLIWVLKTGWFYKIGKRKPAKPALKPSVMIQKYHNPFDRPRLEMVDDGSIVLIELS